MTKIANNKLITKRDLAILTAYTGYMFGEFLDFHEYSEELLDTVFLLMNIKILNSPKNSINVQNKIS